MTEKPADTDSTPIVALLGVGTMGHGMAGCLLEAGLPLRVWNRSPGHTDDLKDQGATVADSPEQAVDGADIVVTMLFDTDAVTEVMEQAGPGLGAETLWIQTSTVGLEGAQRLAEVAGELGVTYVDAPVLGTKKPAEDGALVVLASGPEEVHERCAPVFEAIGSRTMWVGEAGHGSRLKLVVNAWIATVLEGVAESINLARALDLDPQLFLDAVSGGALDAPYVQVKGTAMITGDYTPSFGVDGIAKDASLIEAAAKAVGARMEFTEIARQHLEEVSKAGHGEDDMAATIEADRSA